MINFKRLINYFIILLLVLGLFAIPIQASDPFIITSDYDIDTGINPGSLMRLTKDGTTYYLDVGECSGCGAHSLFKTTDYGLNWNKIRNSIGVIGGPGQYLYANGANLWWAVYDGGGATPNKLHISTDTGATFPTVKNLPVDDTPNFIIFQTSTPNNLKYISHNNAVATCVRIWDSVDNGDTWTGPTTLVDKTGENSCVLHGKSQVTSDGKIFFNTRVTNSASNRARINSHVSTNYGSTWTEVQIEETIVAASSGNNIYIETHTANYIGNEIIYCIGYDSDATGPLKIKGKTYRSLNNGAAWSSFLLTTGVSDIVSCNINKDAGGRYSFSVESSIDASNNELVLGTTFDFVSFLQSNPIQSDFCFATTAIGIGPTDNTIFLTTAKGGLVSCAGGTQVLHYYGFDVASAGNGIYIFTNNIRPIDVRTNYAFTPAVYSISNGNASETYDTQDFGDSFRFNQNLGLQVTASPCNSNLLRVPFFTSDINAPTSITFDNYVVSPCTIKGGNDAVGDDGWGLTLYTTGLSVTGEEFFTEEEQLNFRTESTTGNFVYTLAGTKLFKINMFSHASSSVALSNSAYGLDFDISKVDENWIATCGDNGIRIFTKNLVQKSQTSLTDCSSIAVFDNIVYAATATNDEVRKYNILSDGVLVLDDTFTSIDTDDIGSLKISKDGAYLMALSDVAGNIHDISDGSLVTSTAQFNIMYAQDMDLLNKNYYVAVLDDDGDYKLIQYEVSDVTSAFGNESNLPPSNEVNPYDNVTSDTSQDDISDNPILNTGDTILGINIPATAEGLNISRAAVLLLIAIVLMGVFFIWIYRNTDSLIGGIFGAFLGFLLSIAIALIPQWVMIVVALFLFIVFGKMIFGGFSGDEE